jgi:PPOX class probable F420-dependent enzyme
VIPFVFALVEDGNELRVYWAVDDKPKKRADIQRLDNIRANPAVEFVIDGYDEDWRRLWWVRASGRGRIVTTDDERARAIDALAEKYPRYLESPSAAALVAIDVYRLAEWSAS